MENFKVNIRRSFITMGYEMFIYRDIGNETEYVKSISNLGLETVKIPRNYPINNGEGFIQIPEDICKMMFEAFSLNGMTLPDKSFTEGELVATKSHLKDMRKLLNLN